MTYYISYKVDGIDGLFVMLINQTDDVKYVTSLVRKDFGIIQKLTAKIYGSDLQSTSILSKCVRSQDIVTFYAKENDKIEFYRHPIISPLYQSQTNFLVFTTINFKSMSVGDKIKIDINNDDYFKIEEKIKNMIINKYEINIKSSKLLIFLPGGIPFLKGKMKNFISSFPDFLPHLYAIIITNDEMTDSILDETFDTIYNISNKKICKLISPDCNREKSGLCQMAAVLGYIQLNGQYVSRMIYSIAKFCPFAPLICGLYNLSCLSRSKGRSILQITIPLITLFQEMNKNLKIENTKLLSCTVKFLTYFMNIKICNRVPCTEFIRPFMKIGYENYFYENFNDDEYQKTESIIAFDPDYRGIDWIKFQLPSLTEIDFQNAFNHTNALEIVPPMSLREMHRVSLFRGSNGPWIFLTSSISKEETEKDKIDYINPENGIIEHDTYENIALKVIGVDYKSQRKEFDLKVKGSIDPIKVTQLSMLLIDKSGSMENPLTQREIDLFNQQKLYIDQFESRFVISQKFFTKFAQACYKYHTTSLYGSIMFNNEIDVRNELNPLVNNFIERMIIKNEEPYGGTHLFEALEKAAEILLNENKGNKYPNAVLRIIVISDGDDICPKEKKADVMNFLLQNKIRVDVIVVAGDDIATELVEISRLTGYASIYPQTIEEGLEYFNKEEFFNVDLRQFGEFHEPNITVEYLEKLKKLTPDDLDREIHTKPNLYANPDLIVTSPSYAITDFEKEMLTKVDYGSTTSHPNQKRIITELKKMITNQDQDIKVYPLKDKVDVWRVLMKGFEKSHYDKWYYLIIEFPPQYPDHYPNIRFVYPPFHPNISDQGRICMDTLDQIYGKDKSIKEIIFNIRILLSNPNFDSPIDMKRADFKNKQKEFINEVRIWNDKNGRNSSDDWERLWKIQPDDKNINNSFILHCPIVPENYLCPITHKIMKEPVKATSGVFYEKIALEKYLLSTANPTCRSKTDENGHLIPLPKENNMNLIVNNEMKTKIAKWIQDNFYFEDEDEGNEDDNIVDFINKGEIIDEPLYFRDVIENSKVNSNEKIFLNRPILRPRPFLSD